MSVIAFSTSIRRILAVDKKMRLIWKKFDSGFDPVVTMVGVGFVLGGAYGMALLRHALQHPIVLVGGSDSYAARGNGRSYRFSRGSAFQGAIEPAFFSMSVSACSQQLTLPVRGLPVAPRRKADIWSVL